MKVLKNAYQKNVMVDTEMYTERELKSMESLGFIWKIDNDDVYRVGLSTGDEIKVIYSDHHGFYTNVLNKPQIGLTIYVKL
ncbi:MAG: hypothetical protein J6R30_08510 [Bacteroidales bacterium]|nr:hypothetical protein [Bacteroidales bacterium]